MSALLGSISPPPIVYDAYAPPQVVLFPSNYVLTQSVRAQFVWVCCRPVGLGLAGPPLLHTLAAPAAMQSSELGNGRARKPMVSLFEPALLVHTRAWLIWRLGICSHQQPASHLDSLVPGEPTSATPLFPNSVYRSRAV